MRTHPSLQNRKPIRPYNPDRQARLWEKQFHSEEFVRFVKRHQCVVPGCDRRDWATLNPEG